MRGVGWITLWTGALVALGYLLGGAVATVAARRAADERPPLPALAEAGATVAWITLAWEVIQRVAPPATEFRSASAIGFLSSQVLTVWASVALWSGLAVAVGAMAPVWTGWRPGSSGLAAITAVLAVHDPVLLALVVLVFVGSQVARTSIRTGVAVAAAAAPPLSWWLWLSDGPTLWGVVNGPELTLFTTVAAGAVLARWTRGDVGRPPRPDRTT